MLVSISYSVENALTPESNLASFSSAVDLFGLLVAKGQKILFLRQRKQTFINDQDTLFTMVTEKKYQKSMHF